MTIHSKAPTDDYRDGHERIWGRAKCPRCGDPGIHACPGQPIEPWTEEEKDRLYAAMQRVTKELSNE